MDGTGARSTTNQTSGFVDVNVPANVLLTTHLTGTDVSASALGGALVITGLIAKIVNVSVPRDALATMN